jgi:hypothetical protein
VVIFAMDVTGNSASYRDKLGSGGHGQEPSFGDDDFQHLVQRDTALAFQDAIGRIEGKDLIESGGINGCAGQGSVSVAAAVAPGDEGACLGDELPDILQLAKIAFITLHNRVIAPVGDFLFHVDLILSINITWNELSP